MAFICISENVQPCDHSTGAERKTMEIEEQEGYYRKPGNGLAAELLFFGAMTPENLKFMEDSIRKYKINKTSLTRDGNVRVWNMKEEALNGLLADADAAGIPCQGAYVRNKIKVFSAALAGGEEKEAFDVRPYADRAREFLKDQEEKVKSTHGILKFYFAGQEEDLHEAGDCDMVFVSQEEKTFRVLVRDEKGEFFTLAQKTEAGRFLSYLQVAVQLYNTGLTGETYRGAFWKAMGELEDAQREPVEVASAEVNKTGSGNFTCGPRIIKQKQEDLYAVECHHFGGIVPIAFWMKLAKAIDGYEDIVLRMDRGMNLFVCNLLAEEVHKPLDVMTEAAFTRAEKSSVSDRCGLCVHGMVDPQVFVSVLLKEMRKLRFYDGVLPTFTISGCERCCHTVPDANLVFVTQSETPEGRKPGRYCRVKLHVDGNTELGIMPQQNIAEYLMAVGAMVQSAESDFTTWYQNNKELMVKLTGLYCQDKTEEQE